jgi:hypothetical protein
MVIYCNGELTECLARMAILNYMVAMNETLTIRLDEELVQALEDESRKSGLSKGQIARDALKVRLQQSSKLAVMKRHFGKVSGPEDLSVNKDYRRDWKRAKR